MGVFFFFFQAEDGIRDWSVTGVQTCALPISLFSRYTCSIAVLFKAALECGVILRASLDLFLGVCIFSGDAAAIALS